MKTPEEIRALAEKYVNEKLSNAMPYVKELTVNSIVDFYIYLEQEQNKNDSNT